MSRISNINYVSKNIRANSSNPNNYRNNELRRISNNINFKNKNNNF